MAETAALVLAGGEGRRLGGGKPLRMLRGQPLLQHALTRAQPAGGPIAIAVRSDAWPAIAPELPRLWDTPGLEGPLAALASGLGWARTRGATWLQTLPCDAPFLPQDLTSRLRAAAESSAARAAVPRAEGRAHPASALWRADLSEPLAAYAAGGRRSLLGFAEEVGAVWVDWADDLCFLNVNTPADLALADCYPQRE